MTSAAKGSSTAQSQRAALAVALEHAGPEAPTLCEGWLARDLAAHVVLRDRRPDVMARLFLPGFQQGAQRHMDSVAHGDYSSLVRAVAAGPPRFFPSRIPAVADVMNTVEFFIHTEDVRRGAGPADPRLLPESVERALWKQGSGMVFRLAARKHQQRLTFTSPGFGSVTSGKATADPRTVTGAPGELLLWSMGRERAAVVDLNAG